MNKTTICQLDALEFLAKIPDETVDVCITDPPYWTLDKWRAMGTTTRLGGGSNPDKRRAEMFFETIDQNYMWELFLELDRVLKLDGHLYIFCDDIVQPIISNWVREAKGDHRFGECHTLVWDKVNMGMGYHYRRRYEFVLFCWREKRGDRDGGLVKGFTPRRLANLGIPDVFQHSRITSGYPTEKPPALIQTLIGQSLRIGDTLIDPFAGSGVVAAACPFDHNATIYLNDKADGAIAHMKKRLISESIFDKPEDGFTTFADHNWTPVA